MEHTILDSSSSEIIETSKPMTHITGAVGLSLYGFILVVAVIVFIVSLCLDRRDRRHKRLAQAEREQKRKEEEEALLRTTKTLNYVESDLDFLSKTPDRLKEPRAATCAIPSVQNTFYLFLISFLLVRIAWLFLECFHHIVVITFITNRAASSLFFSSFTIVLFYWVETYHKNYIASKTLSQTFRPGTLRVLIIINLIIYLSQTAFVIIFTIGLEPSTNSVAYRINTIFDASMFFGVALGFFVYGLAVFCRTSRQSHDPLVGAVSGHSGGADTWRSALVRVFVVTILFTACFSLRVGMLVFQPVTDDHVQLDVYYMLAYYIPEMLPSLLQVYVVQTTRSKENEDDEFIENLYAEEELTVDDAEMPLAASPPPALNVPTAVSFLGHPSSKSTPALSTHSHEPAGPSYTTPRSGKSPYRTNGSSSVRTTMPIPVRIASSLRSGSSVGDNVIKHSV